MKLPRRFKANCAFLAQLAAGYVRELSALATSRFPLLDQRNRREEFSRLIPVDKYKVATGIPLLRDRNVKGNDGTSANEICAF